MQCVFFLFSFFFFRPEAICTEIWSSWMNGKAWVRSRKLVCGPPKNGALGFSLGELCCHVTSCFMFDNFSGKGCFFLQWREFLLDRWTKEASKPSRNSNQHRGSTQSIDKFQANVMNIISHFEKLSTQEKLNLNLCSQQIQKELASAKNKSAMIIIFP